jgi:hypothetical protein
MAEPGFSLQRFEEVDERAIGSNEKEPLMKSGVSCLALGFGLLTKTIFAFGQSDQLTNKGPRHLSYDRIRGRGGLPV